MAKVNFISASYNKYAALATKDASTLYFLEDVKKIYKGDVDVTEAIKVVEAFDETPGADVVEGKLYINASTLEVRIKNGDAWTIMSPGYITKEEEFVDSNAGKLATIGATKAYITKQIADITGGTAFVKDVTWSAEDGVLKVDKGDVTPGSVELTGVAHDVVYDKANLKVTIPVYGSEDLVINIPKDNFIRSGRYEAEYDLPDGSKGPAIVLVVDDELSDTDETFKEVVIPAADLVDVYTGGATEDITVTISDQNVVTARVKINPVSGNALVSTANGLMVDISMKADKLTADAADHVLIAGADGDIADSGMTIKSEGAMGQSATEIPVASVIAAAIAAAVKNVQDNLVGDGNPDEVIISTATGVTRSGKKIGGEVLSETADANTLATEAAVLDAISWKTLE